LACELSSPGHTHLTELLQPPILSGYILNTDCVCVCVCVCVGGGFAGEPVAGMMVELQQ